MGVAMLKKGLKKKVLLFSISIIAVIAVFVLVRSFVMSYTLKNLDEKYVLYGRVQDDTDVLGKRVPFDASYLLKQSRYIKASDHQLIDLAHQSITELDQMLLIRIRNYIAQRAKSIAYEKLSSIAFKEKLGNINWEYLYSGFSFGNIQKPDEDYFKFYVTIDGREYRMIVRRLSKSDGDHYHVFNEYIENKKALTYAKYLAQQEGQKQ